MRVWNEFKQLRTAASGGFVHTYGRFLYTDNVPSGSIKVIKFVDHPRIF